MNIKNLLSAFAIATVVLTAGCKKDENNDANLAPTVISTDPTDNALDIVLNKIVTVDFSEAMDPASISGETFTLKQGETVIAGTVNYSGTTATFTPTAALTAATIYTATVTSDVKDAAGKMLEEKSVWSFTTGSVSDVILPTVTSTDPVDNATDVELNKVIAITFSEAMNPASINDVTFSLKQGETVVEGTITYSETTATFTPSVEFEAGTVYTATLSTDATDLAGNALATNKVWSFTTLGLIDLIAPTIISTDPVADATNVARQKVVAINFSEAMDPLTLTSSTFTLKQGENIIVGTVMYNELIATFTPSTPLEVATVYTAAISTEVKDLAGNALEMNTEWSFTTGGTLTVLSPVNLGAAKNYVILAKTAINNNPTSAITGDLGLSPAATSYITGLDIVNATGYATSSQITGKIFAADMADPTPINLTTAVENMITAYNDAAGRPTPDFLELGTGNIGGKTLTPGLYKWTSTVTLPSNVTISGSADDVWIFQISGDLNMSAAVNVTLIGGAQAKNIFWQVAGEASFGATSHFEGIILSMTGITFQTGASFNGRALAQTAVILDANIVVQP